MTQNLIEKARSIRLLALDVDGVLTNGTLYYLNDGIEMKSFHIHDGLGIKLLQKIGMFVAIISGKTSKALITRLNELNIQHAYLDYNKKLPAYEDLKAKLNLSDHEIAYMGDDIPDLPLLKRVGFAITVPNASETIKQSAHMVTKKHGGEGAVREVCEFILKAQNNYEKALARYLEADFTPALIEEPTL